MAVAQDLIGDASERCDALELGFVRGLVEQHVPLGPDQQEAAFVHAFDPVQGGLPQVVADLVHAVTLARLAHGGSTGSLARSGNSRVVMPSK